MSGSRKFPGVLPTVVAIGSGFLAPLLPSPAVGQDRDLNHETIDSMALMVETFIENRWVVGAEMLILHQGDVVLHRGFGMRDLEDGVSMEVGTLFNIRSMAKPLVGAIAQRLIDQGLLALDDPVSLHLPAFSENGAENITVRHLLTHTSGLPDGNPEGRPSDYPTLRSIAAHWGRHGPTVARPGTEFHYSDPGADVLGASLEAVSGLTLDELAERELFRPLAMTDARALISPEESGDPRFCSIYQPDAQGNWHRVWKAGDGSIAPFTIGSGTTWYTTLPDYGRFLSAWLRRGMVAEERWLSEGAVSRALTPGPLMEYPSQIPGAEVRYGQMWQVYTQPLEGGGERVEVFGHSGSDGTYAWAWPHEDLIILYFTQSRGQRTRMLLEQRFGDLFMSPEEASHQGTPKPRR